MISSRKRGFARLSIALGVPYFAWWGWTAWVGYQLLPGYLAKSQEAAKMADWDSSTYWMQKANEVDAQIRSSLLWGVVVPIFALVVLVVGYWVYRGFKPKPPPIN